MKMSKTNIKNVTLFIVIVTKADKMNTFVPYTLYVTLLYSSTIIFWNFFGKTVRHFLLVFKFSIGHNRFSVGQGPVFARDFSWVISNVRTLFQLDNVQFLTAIIFEIFLLPKHLEKSKRTTSS